MFDPFTEAAKTLRFLSSVFDPFTEAAKSLRFREGIVRQFQKLATNLQICLTLLDFNDSAKYGKASTLNLYYRSPFSLSDA